MIAIVSLLMVVVLSILVTRIASIALSHTGLSSQVARFQARSALTGSTRVTTCDTLFLYGRAATLEELDNRPRSAAGERRHREAIAEQEKVLEREESDPPATDSPGS